MVKTRRLVILTIFLAIVWVKRCSMYRIVEQDYVKFSCPNNTATKCAPYFTGIMATKVNQNKSQDYNLLCHVGGKPKPTVTWTKSGEDHHVTMAKKAFKNIRIVDQGNYTCRACNEHGCINHTTEIIVHYKFTKPLENKTAIIGKPFEFQCLLSKLDSDTTVYWYPHTANKLTRNPDGTFPIEFREKGMYDVTYKIDNVAKENEGWYLCEVANSDNDTSAYSSAYLTVVPASDGLYSMIIASSVLAAFLLACALCLCYQRYKKNYSDVFEMENMQKYSYFRKITIKELPNSDEKFSVILERHRIPLDKVDNDNESGNIYEKVNYQIPRDDEWDVPSKNVQLVEKIGEGAFGEVYKATVELQPNTFTMSAVKMLKNNHDDDDGLKDLVSEMKMMKVIGKHKNIVNLLGQCTDGQFMILMEFAAFGNLQKFLVNHQYSDRKLSNGYSSVGNALQESTLLGFARQIAEAMKFLASKKCIHRDLAARNVLVTENLVMKVADFGLTRYTRDKDYYHKADASGRVPFKWMAPESLYHDRYTSRSDVWSFGILLWEMGTMGSSPYGTMTNLEVYEGVKVGLRLDKPKLFSKRSYHLMRECWSYLPQERPDFSDILNELNDIINNLDNIGTVSTQSINDYVDQSSSSESEEEFVIDSSLYNTPLVLVR